MNKLYAILFLSLFLLFQYCRISSYPSCPVHAPSKDAVVLCDCEKQQVADNPGNKDLAGTERSMPKPRPDEVYSGIRPLVIASQLIDPPPARLNAIRHKIPAGYTTTIFQPPRA